MKQGKAKMHIRPMPARRVFETLLRAWGPQHWWPGDTPFEVMVGAILTQNTAWTNVEKAIANLAEADLLDPHRLAACSRERLAGYLKPSGYFNLKAKRLGSFVDYFLAHYDGAVAAMQKVPTADLRGELLGVHGIGPETADSILLYALGRPVFVGDAYTKRFMLRHGWLDENAGYQEMVEAITAELSCDTNLFNEFHALIVYLGKTRCAPKARCEGCPLEPFLNHAYIRG